ncbi:hypothetical protein HFN68_24255 [Rhizobium laguerreae]|uniref:hypothetical protein n=1 Tax=Rhizobium laguerreae TaxID=1076926 RepID=UPI001C91E239|nr:hypothetical protein [Rhizobium laguerreae]MBY3536002.1 hypothetical protein [Rhizobium laguerreae]
MNGFIGSGWSLSPTIFAQTYCLDCLYAGIDPEPYTYRLPNGQFHAVCIVAGATGEWVLNCIPANGRPYRA